MANAKENENQDFSFWNRFPSNWKHYITLTVIVGLIFSTPIFFTMPAFTNSLNFIDKGPIGDTIGGITAPFINLLAAFLIFISFKAQIRTNEIQQQTLKDEKESNRKRENFNTALSLIQQLQEDFYKIGGNTLLKKFVERFNKALTYSSNPPLGDITLSDLINSKEFEKIWVEYAMLLHNFFIVLQKIKMSIFEDDDRDLLVQIFGIFYEMQIKYEVIEIGNMYGNMTSEILTKIPADKLRIFTIALEIPRMYYELEEDLDGFA